MLPSADSSLQGPVAPKSGRNPQESLVTLRRSRYSLGESRRSLSVRPLTIAISNSGLTEPLKNGSVRPDRLKLEYVQVDPITAAMRRMVRGLEFDICEMAFTTYLCARA